MATPNFLTRRFRKAIALEDKEHATILTTPMCWIDDMGTYVG